MKCMLVSVVTWHCSVCWSSYSPHLMTNKTLFCLPNQLVFSLYTEGYFGWLWPTYTTISTLNRLGCIWKLNIYASFPGFTLALVFSALSEWSEYERTGKAGNKATQQLWSAGAWFFDVHVVKAVDVVGPWALLFIWYSLRFIGKWQLCMGAICGNF